MKSGEIGSKALTDVFGWSLPFRPHDFPDRIVSLLAAGGELRKDGELARSGVRFSTIGDMLFMHSAYPTSDPDAVFLGPDTYRFIRALKPILSQEPARGLCVLDIGCGSGAGGLRATALLKSPASVVLSDINDKALRFTQINAAINGVENISTVNSDVMANVEGRFDLIIANPPYLADRAGRLYRDGGGELGSALSISIVEQGLERLNPGGRLVLYTGSPVSDGVDRLFGDIRPRLAERRCVYSYEEIDPDVFGEELEEVPYDQVDRIAAVLLNVQVD